MSPEEIITMITERVQDTANVKVVFGDPVQMEGITVIPIASVKVSGGGGGARGSSTALPLPDEERSEGGMGMGLHVTAKPLGYIEVKDGSARLVSVTDVTKIAIGGMIAGTIAMLTLGKLFTHRMKLKKKRMMHESHE